MCHIKIMVKVRIGLKPLHHTLLTSFVYQIMVEKLKMMQISIQPMTSMISVTLLPYCQVINQILSL